MTARDRKELVHWLDDMFEAIASGRLWEDLTHRSQANEFNVELSRGLSRGKHK